MSAFSPAFARACLLAVLTATTIAFATPPPDRDWGIAWADEFNGSKVDTEKWDYFMGFRAGDSNWRDATYTKEDAYTEDGKLVIRCRLEGNTCYTSYLKSRYQPGPGCFIEISCSFAEKKALGHWVAFWIHVFGGAAYDGNPATGMEVDIMEYPFADNRYGSAVHPGGKSQKTGVMPAPDGVNLREGYHTIGFDWQKDKYVFYIDDIVRWTVTSPISQTKQTILLSDEVQAGAWAGGAAYSVVRDEHLLPDYWRIDYCRVYREGLPDQPVATRPALDQNPRHRLAANTADPFAIYDCRGRLVGRTDRASSKGLAAGRPGVRLLRPEAGGMVTARLVIDK